MFWLADYLTEGGIPAASGWCVCAPALIGAGCLNNSSLTRSALVPTPNPVSMRQLLLFVLLLLIQGRFCRNSTDPPEIIAVSAMCSSDGITASVDFDGPFNGKIYSLDYATVKDCLYYNALDMDTILFSIPAHRCGTRLSRTTRNVSFLL